MIFNLFFSLIVFEIIRSLGVSSISSLFATSFSFTSGSQFGTLSSGWMLTCDESGRQRQSSFFILEALICFILATSVFISFLFYPICVAWERFRLFFGCNKHFQISYGKMLNMPFLRNNFFLSSSTGCPGWWAYSVIFCLLHKENCAQT